MNVCNFHAAIYEALAWCVLRKRLDCMFNNKN